MTLCTSSRKSDYFTMIFFCSQCTGLFFFIKHKLFILLSEGIVFTAAGEVLLTWEEFAP